MLRKISSHSLASSDRGWLRSKFHFSFAEYHNPQNIDFGILRVLNDDLVDPSQGFPTHPHQDMEIISYVVEGELTHGDSMGHKSTLIRGQAQYMSAGTGVRHSEYNLGSETLRFLQIWIYPDKKGYTPNYGEYRFNWEDRQNQWLHLVSGITGEAPIKIHQDANLYALELEAGQAISFSVETGRQAYLVQIEGASMINELELAARDALEIVAEQVDITALTTSHLLVIEMANQTKLAMAI